MTDAEPERRREAEVEAEGARAESRQGRPGRARTLRAIERLLLAAGVVLLLFYGATLLERARVQRSTQADFAHALAAAARSPIDRAEWSAARSRRFEASASEDGGAAQAHAAVALLEIPSVGLSVTVLPGTSDAVLDVAVGLIEGTAHPTEASGNVGIAGHRDGYFRALRHVAAGDLIELSSLAGRASYRVARVSVVEPEDVHVLAPSGDAVLTLVTCYPFYFVGAAPQRYIVHAERVTFAPWRHARRTRDRADVPLSRAASPARRAG